MKIRLLTGAALAVLAASIGHAQSTATSDTASQGAPSVAQSSEVAGEKANSQEIVVTGIRASLQRAQDLKRMSGAVIESVTSEDLGKFADQNIADALQRVPGVQIIRDDSGDSGDRASVRGLGSEYLQTTVNGRTMISVGDNGMAASSLRSFNLDAVPTEVISGMTLYKTPLAQNVEPGLAGELDISTLRPLDYKAGGKVFGSLLVRGQEDNIAKDLRPRVSGVFGAKLFGDTLGFYMSGLASDTRSQIDTVTMGPYSRGDLYFANPNGGAPTKVANVLTTPGGEFYDNDFTQKRRAVSTGLQWKPSSNLEIYADFTYNKYNNDQVRQHSSLSSNGGRLYGSESDPLQPGEVTITDGAVTGFTGLRDGQPAERFNLDGPRFTKNQSDFRYGGLNIKWSTGPLTLIGDYGHSDVNYFGQSATIYSQDIPIDFAYATVGGTPQFSIDPNSVNLPLHASYWDNIERVMKAARDAFKLDARYELAPGWALRLGGRWETSTVDSRSGSTFQFLPQANLQFGNANPYTTQSSGTAYTEETFTPTQVAALDAATYPAGKSFSIFPQFGIPTFQAASLSGFCSVATVLCGQDIRKGSLYQGAFPTQDIPGGADATSPLQFSPINSLYARERNLALYGALDGKTTLFGLPVDGNFGLRAVQISLFERGFSSVRNITADGALESQTLLHTTDRHDYWEMLPNLNLNAHPTDRLHVRFGVARSITLPEYSDTVPSGIITIYDRNTRNYNPIQMRDNASYGNTQLKPMSAWNYDLTAEYYTPWRGSVIASAFLKDISNLIFQSTTDGVSLPGQSLTFRVSGPVNIASAQAKGIELGFNQPLVFLSSPFDGFGLQANYTYVKSHINSNLPAAQFGLPGTSKHNMNLVAYYEKYGLGVRVGLTHRSKTLLSTGMDATLQEPTTELDLNLTYAITKNFEINASIDNITGQDRREYEAVPIALLNYYQRPTAYTFGARFSF